MKVSWSPNPESDVAGYGVFWDTELRYPFVNGIDVGNVTQYTIGGVQPGTYYVTVFAYDSGYNILNDDPNTLVNENMTSGHLSVFAGVVSVTVP